jgi:ethanolamine transporter EutH
MCFSPEMDLTTGVVVAAVGVDALRHVDSPSKVVLASLPALFALHQIDESLVWWGLRGQLPASVTQAAIYVFLAFAFALPFLVPLAMFRSERVPWRRWAMGALLAVGAVTTGFLLASIVGGPVGASIDGHHIAYSADVTYAALLTILYVVATCGSLLAASDHLLAAFGLFNLAVVALITWLTFTGLTSLWCAWAAIGSVAIAAYLRRTSGAGLPFSRGHPAAA